ncbi:MAG: HAD family phosphatase [Candidatus Woesearchaeota archaeon]|nr:MAG: HAD family phosphatase [Candidatus Woesearchaeota archaeon]
MKAVLWDLDGVLVDSIAAHVRAWHLALEEQGLHTSELSLKRLGALPFKETVKRVMEENGKEDADYDTLYKRRKELIYSLFAYIKPFPVVNGLLMLKERGVRNIVVTGSSREFSEQIVEKFFPDLFDGLVTADDVANGKPHPDPYLLGLARANISPEECVVVEDAPLGIASGKAAKITVFALTTTLPKEELHNADKIFASHEDLFTYLIAQVQK